VLMIISANGYCIIEGVSWSDAAFIVILIGSTVGFAEVFPLSDSVRSLTLYDEGSSLPAG